MNEESNLPQNCSEAANIPHEDGAFTKPVSIPDGTAQPPVAPNPKRRTGRTVALSVCATLVVVAAVAVFAAFWTGVLAPQEAAAKYGFFQYVDEDEVTAYIETYQAQMGYSDATDEQWASFLAAYDLTPERLRSTTIYQLVADKLLADTASRLGIEVTDEEADEQMAPFKEAMSLGDEDVWQETLEMYGQTEDDLREAYRKQLLQSKVMEAEVEVPTSTDEEVRSYLADYVTGSGLESTKHSYCLRVTLGEGETVDAIRSLRNAFEEDEHTAENFAAMVDALCTDESLIETGGANGWDYDAGDYSDAYVEQLEKLELDGISPVFKEDDGVYAFIWVSDVYALPTTTEEAEAVDLSTMPESLHEYFSDCEAQLLWQEDCSAYLVQLVEDAHIVYFPCPTDVSYYVDMSLAASSEDDGTATGEGDEGDASAENDNEGEGENEGEDGGSEDPVAADGEGTS